MKAPRDQIFETVLENEVTCRMLFAHFMARGITTNVDPDELTHEELRQVINVIMDELYLRENIQ